MSADAYPRVILPEGFDERRAFETPLRGYLSDVFVEAEDGLRYPVFFVDPVRLAQELEDHLKLGEACFAEPGTIVLPEVNLETIDRAVKSLWQEGFFAHLTPLAPAKRLPPSEAEDRQTAPNRARS
jgi:hypothetical protein